MAWYTMQVDAERLNVQANSENISDFQKEC